MTGRAIININIIIACRNIYDSLRIISTGTNIISIIIDYYISFCINQFHQFLIS